MKNYKELIEENKAWIEETFRKIDNKMSKVTLRSGEILAGDAKDGKHRSLRPTAWTGGFWGGLNLLLYQYTGNEDYLKTVQRSEELLAKGLDNFMELYHDVGFMYHITSGGLYRLTGSEKSKNINLYAASSLASRYVLNGGFLRAWNEGKWRGIDTTNLSIIDCMMNLPILYWASEVIGDDRFKQIGMAHADMALVDHLRPDGSVVHIVDHDRELGEAARTWGGQGYAVGSSWSRGQAWGLYGFILSYIHTKEERYLTAAKQIAHYFIANCCDDWLPRVDFRSPSEPVYYDASAGACAACGLIEIAKCVPEHEAGMYLHAAIEMLKAIGEKFGDFDPETDPMIMYGTTLYPTLPGDSVHKHLIYTDFFYTEAILKLLGSDYLAW